MRKYIKPLLIVLIVVLLFYHGRVIKAKRIQEVRLSWEYQDKKISEEEYKRKKQEITYSSVFLNFGETLKSSD